MNEIWMTAARYRSQLPTIARPRANGDPEDAGGEGNQERTVATLVSADNLIQITRPGDIR
jgi:hypothetical protein